MATLMLSSLGSAVAGPLGAAVGGLLGQAIDGSVFGAGARRGPRLGDLSVQTSSYGNLVPRVYGRMRLAGTVIWATDLQEGTDLQTGAKGSAESATYSYSASLAVAISSRPIVGIGRIWADGQLLRGAEGDLKVRTLYRLHLGSEDQQPDPLIASREGVENTPAFRGLAVAVFEDLELAKFGNRIPSLTFEVIADEAPMGVKQVIDDLSSGLIATVGDAAIGGFAAYGTSNLQAGQELAKALNLEVRDSHAVPASSDGASVQVYSHQLGCNVEGHQLPPIEQEQKAAAGLPSAVHLSFYDEARDYQTGLQKASTGDAAGTTLMIELPAAMSAADAKRCAERRLSSEWMQRTSVRLRLPPDKLQMKPGDTVQAMGLDGTWIVDKVLIDGLVVVTDLKQVSAPSVPLLAAEAGRAARQADRVAEPTTLAIVELPTQEVSTEPLLMLAAGGGETPWRPVTVEVEGGGQAIAARTASRRAVLGFGLQPLGSGGTDLLDLLNSVDVELGHDDDWLQSCDDLALAGGANLAAIGSEIIQFGRAEPIGGRRFRLSRLLRGRAGTEWAVDGHEAAEQFVLLERAVLSPITLSRSFLGIEVELSTQGLGDQLTPRSARHRVQGANIRPPSPVHLRFRRNLDGSATATWVRRSRAGWMWTDGADTPLGEEVEAYSVRFRGSRNTIETTTSVPVAHLTPEELISLGDDVSITVSQQGDLASSRATAVTLSIDEEFAN